MGLISVTIVARSRSAPPHRLKGGEAMTLAEATHGAKKGLQAVA